jgi:hypothetical protein
MAPSERAAHRRRPTLLVLVSRRTLPFGNNLITAITTQQQLLIDEIIRHQMFGVFNQGKSDISLAMTKVHC